MFHHPEDLIRNQNHVWHGVAIGWRNDINASIHFLESTHERVVGIRMSIYQKSLLLVSFYAPTAGHDDDFLESLSHLSEYLDSNMSPGDQVIIGTDCNCSVKSTSRRQLAWNNFCERFELRMNQPPLPTFHHHNGSSNSCIDLFASSEELNLEPAVQYCTLNTPLNLSSHDVIKTSLKVQLEISEKPNKFTNTYLQFDRKKIIWDASKMPNYQELAAKALTEAILYWDTPETIPLLSSLVPRLLVQCATMAFNTQSTRRQNAPKQPSLKI